MTEQECRKRYAAWGNAQVGYREGSNNWNKYAENLLLRQLYGWYAQNQPWCDLFTDVGLIECFGLEKAAAMSYQPIGKGSALCRQSAQYFKDAGAWYERPELGDIVFFYVNGGINHQGIVTAVGIGAITVVEGNSSDMVARRTYAIGSSSIAGYGRPNWAAAATADEQPGGNEPASDDASSSSQAADVAAGVGSARKPTCTIQLPQLQKGDVGDTVRAAQALLIAQRCSCGPDGADGEFGYNTRQAVLNFQRTHGLAADGIVGARTWSALLGV